MKSEVHYLWTYSKDGFLIITPSRFSWDFFLRGMKFLSLSLLGLSGGFLVLLVILGLTSQEVSLRGRSFPKVGASFAHESIGKGTLALSSKQQLGWVADIAKEFVILAYNSRPDVKENEASILVGLKGESGTQEIKNAEIVFLEDAGSKMTFGKEGNSLWVQPILLGQEGILVQVGRKTAALGEEKSEFVVPIPQNAPRGEALKSFHSFNGASFWEQDKLFDIYGGTKFQERKTKYQLQFSSQTSQYVCFVGLGDELVWKEGQWVARKHREEGALPMAKVMGISPQEIKVRVWDATGFQHQDFELKMQTSKPLEKAAGFGPTAIRLRTATQVSCLFGKKRMLVKKGDWLLKTSNGVKNLRTKQEIEQCLEHRLKGELLVIDTIDREGVNFVLKGYLFDAMRTQAIPVSFPVDVEKKKGVKKPRMGAKAQ